MNAIEFYHHNKSFEPQDVIDEFSGRLEHISDAIGIDVFKSKTEILDTRDEVRYWYLVVLFNIQPEYQYYVRTSIESSSDCTEITGAENYNPENPFEMEPHDSEIDPHNVSASDFIMLHGDSESDVADRQQQAIDEAVGELFSDEDMFNTFMNDVLDGIENDDDQDDD